MGGRVGGAFLVMNDVEDDVRVRDAMKAHQTQLALFADNIPGPIAYLDRNLKYTFVNQAFANLARKPQDEIYGARPGDPRHRCRQLPATDPAPCTGRRVDRLRARRTRRRRQPALDARPHRAGSRRDRAGARRVLHRVRHSRAQDDRAGWRSASSSFGSSPTTFPSRSSISMPDGATRSSTRPSSTSPGIRANRCWAGP